MRGFDIRGVGPRVIRTYLDTTTGADTTNTTDDALGGNAYYKGRLELELPLGNGARELGLRPSIFMDAGSVFSIRRPATNSVGLNQQATDANGALLWQDTDASGVTTITSTSQPAAGSTRVIYPKTPFREDYYSSSAKPRLSVGFGVNWNSPFGPFRIDIAKALLKQKGDDTKLFTFNVGTQF
jgi:outer membrane protein insertion porin family